MDVAYSLETLPHELLTHITLLLEPSELVSLLKCNRIMYERIVPILWQHIQFFAPSKLSEFVQFSNVNRDYLALPLTAHMQAKAIAARLQPESMALDKLSEALIAGWVSKLAVESIQQLTIYTQNRFSNVNGFKGFVEQYLLRPGLLKGLKLIRVINDASQVIQAPNKFFFDDEQSITSLTDAIDNLTNGALKNRPANDQIEIRLFARYNKLALRLSSNEPTATSITFLHLEYVPSVDETIRVCDILKKMKNLKVLSLSMAKLRVRFSRDRVISAQDISDACTKFVETLKQLHRIESLSMISDMLIQNMDFNKLPTTIRNLEINRQIVAESQFKNLGDPSEVRSWSYFLTQVKYPTALRSLRINHLTKGSPGANVPISAESITFTNLVNINLIGHDLPPGTDVAIFSANHGLKVVTMDTISHAGLKILVQNSHDTLRELTIAKNTTEMISDSTDMFTEESLSMLKLCKNLRYLYVHIVQGNLSGDVVGQILKGCPYLVDVYIEYTIPGLHPHITPEEMEQYRWFEALPREVRIPRQLEYDNLRRTFTPRPDDDSNLPEFLNLVGTWHEPINNDSPYVFRDFRIKPTRFGVGCIFHLDIPGFRHELGI